MNWYYAEGDRQAGPVTEEQLRALVSAGNIGGDTYVWKEGMAEWKPFNEVKDGLATGAPAPAAGPGEAGKAPAPAAASGQAVCVECGRLFPESEMISYQGMKVCGNCKPAFFQKVQEGTAAVALNYAGFWIRLGAVILDSILLFFGYFALMMIFMPAMMSGEEVAPNVIFTVLTYALYIFYYVFFHGKFGATPGKMAVAIKVVMPDGSPITYARAFGRMLGELVNGFTFTIGYIIAAFDKEKRALHDFIANTRVIHK